mmetsp:Transcript_34559/g.30355  ORF Transcript_34559/g.30355 Transcript_34559/m.30355 type:complete len:175 (+) Transcript_34559:44-568(+)
MINRVARNSIQFVNHHSMRYFSVTTTTTTNNDGKSNWKLPEKDEDYQRYLMRYENVVGHEFLESMRDQYIKWNLTSFTDKQKQGIRNCVGHSSTRVRRALYPNVLTLDPIMKELLLLTEKDLQYAETQNPEMAEKLKNLRDDLNKNNSLTFKQLQFAGSLLSQFFGEDDNTAKK